MKEGNKNEIKNKAQTHFVRLFFSLIILMTVIIVSYIILKNCGIWEKINSIEKLKKIVESGGAFSFAVFVILQILQTTLLQIPSMLITIAGSLVFGAWTSFFLSFFAVMLGSVIMFWVGRKAGTKFLHWLIGSQDAGVWIERLSKGKYLFFIMMLFPLFPDDMLCIVAGMTNMSFKYFFWTNILARGIGIAFTVFFGTGSVIPFNGWGLVVWGVLIVSIMLLFYLSVKYQDKLDVITKKFFSKH